MVNLDGNSKLKTITVSHVEVPFPQTALISLKNTGLQTLGGSVEALLARYPSFKIDISDNANLICEDFTWILPYVMCSKNLIIGNSTCADIPGMVLNDLLRSGPPYPCPPQRMQADSPMVETPIIMTPDGSYDPMSFGTTPPSDLPNHGTFDLREVTVPPLDPYSPMPDDIMYFVLDSSPSPVPDPTNIPDDFASSPPYRPYPIIINSGPDGAQFADGTVMYPDPVVKAGPSPGEAPEWVAHDDQTGTMTPAVSGQSEQVSPPPMFDDLSSMPDGELHPPPPPPPGGPPIQFFPYWQSEPKFSDGGKPGFGR